MVDARERIGEPSNAYELLKRWRNKEQEHLLVLLLDGSHKIIKIHVATIGLANSTMIHPREVFKEAIRKNALAIIVAHNHPSGTTEPSSEDIEITRRLKEAGELIGIPVLDHIIISRFGWSSFKERGLGCL